MTFRNHFSACLQSGVQWSPAGKARGLMRRRIKNLLSHSLLRDRKRSRPKNSTCIFVCRYLNEEDILDAQFLTEKFRRPIHNRCLGYSCWTFSPFWQHPNQLASLGWVKPVEFIGYHGLLPIFSLPKARIIFSNPLATLKARYFPILFLSQ